MNYEGSDAACCSAGSPVYRSSVPLINRADQIMAEIGVKILKGTSVLSYDYNHSKSDQYGNASFNDYAFSDVGMSWVGPLARKKSGEKPKPTPVVVDGYAHEVRGIEVEAMLEKLSRVTSGYKHQVVGAIIAPGFTPSALKEARGANFVAIPLATLLGPIVGDMLEVISALKSSQIEDWPSRLENLDQTFQYAGNSPLVASLRSLALEALAGVYTAARGFPEHLSVGRKFRWGTTVREVDAFGVSADAAQALVVECKAIGSRKELAESDVFKFVTETIPAAIQGTLSEYSIGSYRAELWTTGIVTSSVRSRFDQLVDASGVDCELLDGSQLKHRIANTRGIERLQELAANIGGQEQSD